MGTVYAIDIGGTKIAGGIVDADGAVLLSQTLPTRAREGGPAILQQVADLLQYLQRQARDAPPLAIGIATGGQIDATGRIVGGTAMIPHWVGLPLRETIAARFALPTAMLNDGHAAALAEAQWGAGQAYPSLFCLVVGTGLGGGLVIDGRLQHGAHGLAGSIGQLKVRYGDGYVPLETLVSGPGLVRLYQQRAQTTATTGKAIAEKAQRGEEAAVAAAVEMGGWLGLGLSHALHAYDAACVVVGGSVAQIGPLFLEACRRSLHEHGHETVARTPVIAARFGATAGLMGAALWARQQIGER